MTSDQQGEFRAGHPFVWATAFLAGAVLIAALVYVAVMSERDRQVRIDAAEDKYGLIYVTKTGDGEGGGLWRFPDGDTVSCQIDGDTSDPELRCAPGMTEPPEVGCPDWPQCPPVPDSYEQD